MATSTYTDPGLRRLRAPARDANDLAQVLAGPRPAVRTTIDQVGEGCCLQPRIRPPRRPPWRAEPELATLIHDQFSAAGCGLIGNQRRRFVAATAVAAVTWALYPFFIGRLGGKALEGQAMSRVPRRVRRHDGSQRADRGGPADQVPPEGGTGRAKGAGKRAANAR